MIVITGAGLLSAIGTNQAETLQSLRDARAGLHPVRFLPTVHRELPVARCRCPTMSCAAWPKPPKPVRAPR